LRAQAADQGRQHAPDATGRNVWGRVRVSHGAPSGRIRGTRRIAPALWGRGRAGLLRRVGGKRRRSFRDVGAGKGRGRLQAHSSTLPNYALIGGRVQGFVFGKEK